MCSSAYKYYYRCLLCAMVKKVGGGSVVYTDKWKDYHSLMFSGYRHLNIDHDKKFVNVRYTQME